MREMLIPATLRELTAALGGDMTSTKLICGGTDLTIALHEHRESPARLIDVSGVRELREISVQNGCISIGAACTYTELAQNAVVQRYLPALRGAAEGVGSKQIRNRGTVGGNLANASPAGDCIPALLALGATAVLVGGGGTRSLPIAELVLGPNETALRPDEAIAAITIPTPPQGAHSAFVKLGARARVTIAKISLAASIVQHGGVITQAALALGAVGRSAFLSQRAANALIGQADSPALRTAVAELLSEEIERSIPGRASLPYKREAVRGLTEDLLARLFPPAP